MSDVVMQRIGVRSRVASHLESAKDPVAAARAFAKIAAVLGARHIARPLCLPRDVRVIGVGGATLGGSYKTPFAIALAEKLAHASLDGSAERATVVFAGHAYRARVRHPRIVRFDDDVREVGDDALVAARRLAAFGVPVVVAQSRQAAVDFASRWASQRRHSSAPACLVVDGLLQTRPHRLARSILVLGEGDAVPAWCPPAGDLRAPLAALRRASDASIVIDDELGTSLRGVELDSDVAARSAASPADFCVIARMSRACDAGGSSMLLADLARPAARVGLLLAIARPDRVLRALARREVRPRVVLAFGDHDVPTPRELARAASTHCIDIWLTTAKCATKLPSELRGAPILTLEHALTVSDDLAGWATGEAPRGQSLPSSPARRA